MPHPVTGVACCRSKRAGSFHGFGSPEEASTKLSMDASTFRDLFSANIDRLSVSCGVRDFDESNEEKTRMNKHNSQRPFFESLVYRARLGTNGTFSLFFFKPFEAGWQQKFNLCVFFMKEGDQMSIVLHPSVATSI